MTEPSANIVDVGSASGKAYGTVLAIWKCTLWQRACVCPRLRFNTVELRVYFLATIELDCFHHSALPSLACSVDLCRGGNPSDLELLPLDLATPHEIASWGNQIRRSTLVPSWLCMFAVF